MKKSQTRVRLTPATSPPGIHPIRDTRTLEAAQEAITRGPVKQMGIRPYPGAQGESECAPSSDGERSLGYIRRHVRKSRCRTAVGFVLFCVREEEKLEPLFTFTFICLKKHLGGYPRNSKEVGVLRGCRGGGGGMEWAGMGQRETSLSTFFGF